jgi:hypothetical protein
MKKFLFFTQALEGSMFKTLLGFLAADIPHVDLMTSISNPERV